MVREVNRAVRGWAFQRYTIFEVAPCGLSPTVVGEGMFQRGEIGLAPLGPDVGFDLEFSLRLL